MALVNSEDIPKKVAYETVACDMRDADLEKYLIEKRKQILDFAQKDEEFGLKTFRQKDESTGQYVNITVPYRAFIHACLARARLSSLAPDYKPFCCSGLKLFSDCASHTDAWIGCGGTFENAYDESNPSQRLFMKMLHEVQQEYTKFDFTVLTRGSRKYYSGVVETDPDQAHADCILVLKNADAHYADAALKCTAVICETGSKIAHLVVVSAEEGIGVFRVDNACTLFKQGQRASVCIETGVIRVL